MHVRTVDIDSDADLTRWHAVYAASNEHGRPHATTWTYPEFVVGIRQPSTSWQRTLFVAEEQGLAVGVADVELPLRDNLHIAEMSIAVHPDQRQRGIGTALATRLRDEAEQGGRRLAQAWVPGAQLAPDGAVTSIDEPAGDAFARRLGLTQANTDLHRILDLPVDDAILDRLAADARPHHTGYRIVGYSGACPAEHVDAYCRLKSAMIAEAPMGDLEMEPEAWDERRLREEEAELGAMGRTRLSVLAIAADGEVAGFNELLHPVHDPDNVYNWDTLVVPAHRGHRLGLALKVDNLKRLQTTYPGGKHVHTHNAAQNVPMIAVNDALGFVPVERVGEWQGPVSGLPRGSQ